MHSLVEYKLHKVNIFGYWFLMLCLAPKTVSQEYFLTRLIKNALWLLLNYEFELYFKILNLNLKFKIRNNLFCLE